MLAHIHIMKTAGQTIRNLLRKTFGATHCDLIKPDSEKDISWAAKCYPNLDSLAGHQVRPSKSLDRYFPQARYFTLLREPGSRAISHYQFHHKNGWNLPAFPEWIKENANRTCLDLTGNDNAEEAIELLESRVGFVGLQERFNESLLLWESWANHPRLSIHYKSNNIARDNSVRDEILSDPRTPELLEEYHQADLKIYQHVVQNIYPKQQAEFPGNLKQELEDYESSLNEDRPTILSFQNFLGKAKRNIIYKPGLKRSRKAA